MTDCGWLSGEEADYCNHKSDLNSSHNPSRRSMTRLTCHRQHNIILPSSSCRQTEDRQTVDSRLTKRSLSFNNGYSYLINAFPPNLS